MAERKLNTEQVDVVDTFFDALAFFREEEYINPDSDFLSPLTSIYAMIMTDGGGDPVKLAARLVFGEDAVDLKLLP